MSPTVAVLWAWLLFGGSHLLLSATGLREFLSRHLGRGGFTLLYTLIAALSLSVLGVTVAHVGGSGAPGPALGATPLGLWTLRLLAFAGAGLTIAGLFSYRQSPMAILSARSSAQLSKPLHPPGVVASITRHPFFVGLALLMATHALAASTRASAVYFAGFAILSVLGIPLQDRKLRAKYAEVYAEYMRQTAAVPFTGGDQPTTHPTTERRRALLIALIGGAVLFALHPVWQSFNGAPFALLTAAGGVGAVVMQYRRRMRNG